MKSVQSSVTSGLQTRLRRILFFLFHLCTLTLPDFQSACMKMQHNNSDGHSSRSCSSSGSVINLNASEMSVIWRWALWSFAHWPRDACLPFPSAHLLLFCFCFCFPNWPLSLHIAMVEAHFQAGGIYLFIYCRIFLLIKRCCKGPCDEIRQRCLNKGWRVHNCRSYRSEVPGANCQSWANDDKCLSMQIAAAAAAAAVQAGRQADAGVCSWGREAGGGKICG